MTPNIDCYRVLAAVYIGVVLKAMYIYIANYMIQLLQLGTVPNRNPETLNPKP